MVNEHNAAEVQRCDSPPKSPPNAASDSSDRYSKVKQTRGIRRLLYWLLAGVFFALAMVGVVLPGIPTTPFLLLMCYFLMGVSPSLHAKAMAWPVISGPLRDWEDQGGVRSGVKWIACLMVIIFVGSTLVWAPLSSILKTIIACAAICGLIVIYRLPIASINR